MEADNKLKAIATLVNFATSIVSGAFDLSNGRFYICCTRTAEEIKEVQEAQKVLNG